MNVLSLFDGMSCGQIALNKLGMKYDNYFACEIDKYAIKVTQENFPNTKQLGDVTKVDFKSLPKIDLLIGGSPCQGFSFAGKQLNFNDPRSALFFEFVKALKETNPKYFLLENVRMKKEYQDVISEHLGVEPVMINSSLVSAQNRKRLYWCNWKVELPKDKGIVLADIIEENDATFARIVGRRLKDYKRVDYDKSIKVIQRVEINENPNKSNCLSMVQKDNVLVYQINPSLESANKQPYMQNRVFHLSGKSHALTASFASSTNVGDFDELSWRKLTPIECERLQTVPDNYTNHVSNTQRYKMLGNGWTIDVICHILKDMKI